MAGTKRAYMERPQDSSFTTSREELEEFWRIKLREAQERYTAATAEYRRILQNQPEGSAPCPGDSLERARHAQSDSLAEYSRVLAQTTHVLKSLAEFSLLGGFSEETRPQVRKVSVPDVGKSDLNR